MKPELPVNRSASAQRQTTGILSQPASATSRSGESSASARANSAETGGLSLKVERHGRWALLSRAQSQLSQIQGSEQAIVSSYRELLELTRRLERAGSNSSQLSARVAQLKQQLAQGNHLDGNLKLRQGGDQASYVMDRVDLLSPRDQSETLGIQLPNGRSINLTLDAGSSPAQQIHRVSQALQPFELKADRNDQGQLRLSGPRELLSSPWVFRGQGVRVPAGNPVPIQLGQEADQLSRLQAGLDRGDVATEKQRLRELLNTLEQQRRALENQRQQLLRQIAQLQANQAQTTEQHTELSGAIKSTLQTGDFTLQLNTLMAQANVSRSSVVALLGR